MNSKRKAMLVSQLQAIQTRHGQPVALIGWSLGGVFARELARAYPDRVSQVFTLGSPINGDPEANNVTTLFNLFNPKRPPPDREAFEARIPAPPVPCTAIFTRQDGIVSWQCSQEEDGPLTDNVEVQGTHVGLPWNPQVLAAIAERLARYRHFKGNEYQVIGTATHSETGDTLVVYRPLYGDQALWVRPLAMFTETVERDGKVQPRFARIGD